MHALMSYRINFFQLMLYYVFQSYMGAHLDVCVCFIKQLVNECLISHITNIRVLTTMYMLMSFQIGLLNECLITHITKKGAHHYVGVYAL
jgi:hypothetical protein